MNLRGYPLANRRKRYLSRALRSVVFGVVVGLSIAFVRQQPLATTVVYSACISLACWFFIESGRYLVATYVGTGDERPGWPGWRWMTAVVIVGGCLGMLGGTLLGDTLTGQHTPHLVGCRRPAASARRPVVRAAAGHGHYVFFQCPQRHRRPGSGGPGRATPGGGKPPAAVWRRSSSRTCSSTRWPICTC